MSQETMQFPSDFVWGTATASYQIEGGVHEGGRGPSIWDTFSHTPGKIHSGDTGDTACDHYHRWQEDIGIIDWLGVGAYRLSIAWPRIMPTEMGGVNQAGLDFYGKIIDALNARNIKPVVTLYHWDLPQYLQDKGGWASRDTAFAFQEYARVLAREFAGRVSVWTTLNEPWCSAYLGYAAGVHAPGIQDPQQAMQAVHHLNLAHGLAAMAIREECGADAQISVTLNLHVVLPDDPTNPSSHEAAQQIRLLGNEAFLGPMLEGTYPPELVELTSRDVRWDFIHDGDLALINQPLDVLGVNYYNPTKVRMAPEGAVPERHDGHDPSGKSPWVSADRVEFLELPGEKTEMGWPIDATGLTELLLELSERYPDLPLMVTENGMADADPNEVTGGQIDDPKRISYLRDHIAAVHAAIEQGADVRGYFVWSLLDNFEWSYEYTKRFGIVHVNYTTLERTPKASAHWYRKLIQSGRIPA
ncbi:GH1 family beta-glucosidase [Actinotignum sp. GS-2025b]|uniref:GH1 family beta-glucosidase n=1 Tax=Actinotignum sp. GS-2025b TaxID=3427275 RepID=UPI003F48E13B